MKAIMRRCGFWVTKQMAQEKSRQFLLEITLKEIMFYAIFVILVTVFAVGMTFSSMYYLTKVLQELFVERDFSTVRDVEIKFEDIKSAADVWAYCETALLDGIFWKHQGDNPAKETDILYENKLLGVPRLRQLKVRNDSCVIHEYFRRMFLACYGKYSRDAEDKASYGPGTGSAWTFSTNAKTGSLSYWGSVARYYGGGYYQDLSSNRGVTEDIIADLKENLWITRGTRCVFLDFTVYNGNLNLFCAAKIIFEFPPTGGVLPSYKFNTLKLIRYVTVWDYFILACELLVVCFVVYYTIEEVREMVYFGCAYFKDFWNYMDLILLMLAYSCLALSIIRYFVIESTLDRNLKITNEYANFEYAIVLQIVYNCLVAIFLFITYAKIFKYLSFNKTMGQLNNTLHRCALDIFGFSVMFFIIFFAYAELGYLLFGTQVQGFSTFGIAMFTLLRTILGDFDYMEIESANRILAPIYFITYIFLVFFVLLNMFLAIINDTYSDVKTEISLAPDEMQMSEYLKRGIYSFLNQCGCKSWVPKQKIIQNEYNVTIEEIRGALKRCGFKDLEIEMFFARYNIDPTAEVGDFDIEKLMGDLERRPGDETRSAPLKTGRSPGGRRVSLDDFMGYVTTILILESLLKRLAIE